MTARNEGLVVSAYFPFPAEMPVRSTDGWWLLTCEGGGMAVQADRVTFHETDGCAVMVGET